MSGCFTCGGNNEPGNCQVPGGKLCKHCCTNTAHAKCKGCLSTYAHGVSSTCGFCSHQHPSIAEVVDYDPTTTTATLAEPECVCPSLATGHLSDCKWMEARR